MADLMTGDIAGLTVLDALPDGLLESAPRDLYRLLDCPTLIELKGKRDPPLFVSILLHGNEDSGLGGVQSVLRKYTPGLLPRSLMLLVGNVEAARYGLRRLDDQPDFNRIWPGTREHAGTAHARIMAEVHARVVKRRAIAAMDLHNNSGRNPHYSVVCNLDPATLGFAALFSRRAVCFRGVPGTQTASFAGLLPAVTAECGKPGEAANVEAAARFFDAALNLDRLPHGAPSGTRFELYHTIGVVRVKEGVSFSFADSDAELQFDPALDERNFHDTQPGTVLGETGNLMPLQMLDEAGIDVAERYFECRSGKLTLIRPAVPAMLTTDPVIVRQDCLCYLMERLS